MAQEVFSLHACRPGIPYPYIALDACMTLNSAPLTILYQTAAKFLVRSVEVYVKLRIPYP